MHPLCTRASVLACEGQTWPVAVCFTLTLVWCLQYSQLGALSVGPISYSEDERGNVLPLVICKSLYKKRRLDPLKHVVEIETEMETGEKSASSLTHEIDVVINDLKGSLSFCIFFSLFVV